MPQRKMRRLATATIAVGLIGGLAFGSPSAMADPAVAPVPVPVPIGPLPGPVPAAEVPGPAAPIDPAAAIAPAPPPPADPLARSTAAAPCRPAGRSTAAAPGRPVGGSTAAACEPVRTAGRSAGGAAADGRFPKALPGVRTRRRTPASRCSCRRRSIRSTAPWWVWPSRSSSTSRGRSPTARWRSRRSTSRPSRRCRASSTG